MTVITSISYQFTNIYFQNYTESGHFQQLNGAELAFCLWNSYEQ